MPSYGPFLWCSEAPPAGTRSPAYWTPLPQDWRQKFHRKTPQIICSLQATSRAERGLSGLRERGHRSVEGQGQVRGIYLAYSWRHHEFRAPNPEWGAENTPPFWLKSAQQYWLDRWGKWGMEMLSVWLFFVFVFFWVILPDSVSIANCCQGNRAPSVDRASQLRRFLLLYFSIPFSFPRNSRKCLYCALQLSKVNDDMTVAAQFLLCPWKPSVECKTYTVDVYVFIHVHTPLGTFKHAPTCCPPAGCILLPVSKPCISLWALPCRPCSSRHNLLKASFVCSLQPCLTASSCTGNILPRCFLVLQLLLWSITSSREPSSPDHRDNVCALAITPVGACPNWKLLSFLKTALNFASLYFGLDFINSCHQSEKWGVSQIPFNRNSGFVKIEPLK